ncbi:MAG: archease [Dehalococcoidia bacterium]
MARAFEIVDHTADIGIRAHGADLKEAFANAGLALSSLVTDVEKVREGLHRDLEVTASDEEALLVAWLNELIYVFDVDNIIFKRFDIQELSPTRLRARAYGEKVDPSRHPLKMGIKAATYHRLKIEKGADYTAQVIFDI